MPAVEMLRMTSSGTEASMSAIRLARAATGREKLLKFAGAYHGHVDGLLAEAGSGLATAGQPSSARASPPRRPRTRSSSPWNDPDGGRRAPSPSTSSPRSSPSRSRPTWASSRPRTASSSCCATRATENGALLVFDEVITGFRVARGGAQELTSVEPDLACMGKVIGGGLPAAAYGGPRTLMERIAPAGDVYQAGTLSGNPLAVAAGLATLAMLDEQAYLRLAAHDRDARGRPARGGRRPAGADRRPCPACSPSSSPRSPCATTRAAQAADHEAYAAWCRALLARGVYAPPSPYEAWFPSLAHTPEHVERTVEAAAAAFAEIAMSARAEAAPTLVRRGP